MAFNLIHPHAVDSTPRADTARAEVPLYVNADNYFFARPSNFQESNPTKKYSLHSRARTRYVGICLHMIRHSRQDIVSEARERPPYHLARVSLR